MNILITGGAGYIGSHTNKFITENSNNNIIVYDNLSRGHRESVLYNELIEGDIRDQDRLDQVLRNRKIDIVIHFAALAYVEESVNNPGMYYDNNVVGTISLLNSMIKNNVNNIVFSSTCATYGVPKELPIKETHTQNPINPYGNTKLVVEKVLEDYHKSYGINYVALRYFNAAGADPDHKIGESHTPETHLIPLVLDATNDGRCVKVYGTDYDTNDGTCIRDYIHVNDLANAHYLATKYLEAGNSDVFNLGTSNGYSVLDVIRTSERVTNKKVNYIMTDRRVGDPPILTANNKKARNILNWVPKKGLEDIINDSWNWYNTKLY